MTPLATEILNALPSLRRYACALSGSRRSGDEYIRVALEALIEEPWCLETGRDVRFGLYELFHRTLEICDLPRIEAPEAGDPYSDVKRGLLMLPLLSRQLVLLVTLEGFSLERAAELVHVSEFEATSRIAAARRSLRRAGRAVAPVRARSRARAHTWRAAWMATAAAP